MSRAWPLLLIGVMVAAVVAWRGWLLRRRTREHWLENVLHSEQQADSLALGADARHGLVRWLALAGFRSSPSAPLYVTCTLVCLVAGVFLAAGLQISGIQNAMERSLGGVPGGVGEAFLPAAWAAPWLIPVLFACLPFLFVRRARRQRVELVEQDLPLVLELLSTLSEAGLGFDAALGRILNTRLAGRPLAGELRTFQADLLAGRSRIESLRRLSSRLEVPSVSVTVSALAQAEQLGMGIARVLRQQADDVRARRREKVIAFANTLATKRVIPMVICFLPGLFVWTLGPAFVQLFKMVETFIQIRS